MQWWLNVLFLINGAWALGVDYAGWGPLPVASESICIERKRVAEKSCREHPLPYPALWLCTAGAPLTEVPPHLRGLLAEKASREAGCATASLVR